METVNKYVNAASTVIWGDDNSPQAQQHGEEPISGVQGRGRATDPYDAGNRDGMYDLTKHMFIYNPQFLDCHNAIYKFQKHHNRPI